MRRGGSRDRGGGRGVRRFKLRGCRPAVYP